MVNLKSLLSRSKEDEGEYFWSLVIEPGWVQAGIWTIIEGKAEIISISPPTAWKSDEELISASDTSLSAAIQNLDEEAPEPSKTVFGVPSTWVSEGQIKKEYLEKLKTLCSELSLEPTGFVTLPEAIAHLVKTQEGSPLSAVTVGISEENLEISVFRLGKLVGTSHVARSVSVFEDVVEGLTRFSGDDNLPSRFIVYDGKEGEMEEARQGLLDGQWDEAEKVKFLHTPKIEILSPEKKVTAVCLGGASEIADVSTVAKTEEEKVEEEEDRKEVENVTSPEKDVSPEEVGFVVGEDVAKDSPKTAEKKEPVSAGEEVEKEGPVIHRPQHEVQAEQKQKVSDFDKGGVFDSLSKVKNFLASIGGGILQRPQAMDGRRTFIFGGAIFLILLVVGVLVWWFYPKATVTIFVSPRRLNEDISVAVDPEASSVNFSERVLPGKVVSTSESGEKTTSTTGTRTVGERATGEVTLYRSGSEITLPAGTTLGGPNNLNFTLDESVTVASGSAGSPGTASAAVTAADIGSQYNLESGTSFSVGNYTKSEIEAQNDNAFSGGSSREIAAVSEEDQENLLDELTDELAQKARDSLKSNLSEDEYFIEESVVPETSSRDFSAQVGDEADTLRLSLEINAEGVVVDRQQLFDIAREVLKDRVPDGYVLRESQIDFDFELVETEEDEGVYELELAIDANLLPEINTEEIAKQIAGKYPPLAQDYLRSIPGFTRAQIRINPDFPGRLGTLPRVVKNISVEVAAER